MASTEVNIAVFEEEPSAPVRIFMRRTLSYARPQSELCRAPSWTRTLLGAADRVGSDDPGRESRRIGPYGAASLHNIKCELAVFFAAEFVPETAPVDALVSSDAFAVVFVASPYLTQDDTLVTRR
jgi:hypothetical protein